jgi:hypothetical protein
MQVLFVGLLLVHALSSVFWAGTTFALVRSGGQGAQALRWPQVGASIVAIVSGMSLWAVAHRGAFGPFERSLAVGAVAALLAAAVQFAGARRAAAAAATAPAGEGAARPCARTMASQRIAAGLLALALAAMVSARYF